MTSPRPEVRGKLALLGVLVGVHLVVSLFAVVPGHLSIDEGTYHMMVRSRAAGYGAEVWNGYRELPSPELAAAATLVEHDGRLVAVPPELFSILAQPFYRTLGYRGLFLVNALAFLGVLAAVWSIGRDLWDRRLATDACLLAALATFLWEYSQAAWPHMLSALFVTAALALCVRSLVAARAGGGAFAGGAEVAPESEGAAGVEDEREAGAERMEAAEAGREDLSGPTGFAARRRGGLGWAFAAGLVAGLAPGVRVDAILALPAVLLPHLFARPVRGAAAAATLAGTLPGLLWLAWINQGKFGTWSPVSYGGRQDLGRYLLPVLAAAAVLVAAWAVSRGPVAGRLAGARWARPAAAGAVVLGVAAAVLVFVPVARDAAVRLGGGAWQLLVDLRARPLEPPEPALGRTPGGAMVYIGALKRSLLESCPYLAALLLPAAAALRAPAAGWRLLVVAQVPAVYVGFYSWFAWHGGLALNLRYWVPALPFLALLAAWAWRLLGSAPPRGFRLWAAGAGVSLAVAYGILDRLLPELVQREVLLLDLPLVLAAILLLLVLPLAFGPQCAGATEGEAAEAGSGPAAVPRSGPRARLATAAALAFVLGAVWAGLVAFTHDYPRHRRHRAANLAVSARLAGAVSPDSLLFASYPDPFYGLLETTPRLRLAVPGRDGFADFRRLTFHHASEGRRVFAALPRQLWPRLGEAGLLEGLAMRRLPPDGSLLELRPAPDTAAGEPAGAAASGEAREEAPDAG